ncbi:allene oxide synthase 1, chloroplastic-like [Ipomoea triloba]|uniref:allene oxide synthase 1, chloroplastic-like n=1 Tax=Ipomoea triloba TaxID=35885 RepID=UPI00125E3DBF|nr:allene oxide synthase 1, chloroplastic-like [Ipomoea triloba]
MASASSVTLQFHLPFQKPSKNRPSTRRLKFQPVCISVSENTPAAVSVSPRPPSPATLPLRKIPGDYGLPFVGPMKDRLDYFYNQGREEFFRQRIQKYQSTVFRTNMPPGPFISSDSKVVCLLDGKSFPTLFDVSVVEKRDVFTGTYMPSTELTGGYRILSYIDPSEPSHAKLKNLMFFLLSHRRHHLIPEFHNSYADMFHSLETQLATNGKAGLNAANDQAAFNFLARSLYGVDPIKTKLRSDAPKLIGKWVLFNLHPVLSLGLPKQIEDPLLHTFRLPPALVKKDYKILYDFFYENSTAILDHGEILGISREEACHNLVFATCFNSFGGMKIFFPNMLKWIGRAGVNLHTKLAKEIRSIVKSNGGKITMAGMEQMELMKSTVYESFRIEPPVPTQYGRAKRDIVIESHDARFQVKEGEMLFGFQPFATKDPKIFDRAQEFVPNRFVGEKGKALLKHVLWSNGRETENPTVNDKQCAGKDFVMLVSRLMLVEFFLRYDSFDIEVGMSPLGASVTLTSLKRATF